MPAQIFAETATPEAALTDYLGGKIISNGGDAIVRSSDGLTYDIGLKTQSGSSITSVRFKPAATPYITAWKVDEKAISDGYLFHREHTNTSVPVQKRPASTEGAYSAKVTVMIFNEGTSKSDINSGTAQPAASKDITLNILPEDPVYSVSFKAVDSKTQEEINGATVTVEKDWNTVYPDGNIYKMPKGDVYNVKATANGYKNYTNSSFTATASGEVKLPMEKILSKKISFNVTDKEGNAVNNPEITVKKGYSNVSPEKDGSYNMVQGETYSYTVKAKGFKDVTGNITPSEDTALTLDVQMDKVVLHKITFNITDTKNKPVEGATLTVKKGYDEIKAEKDGSYLLEEGVEYKYSVKRSNYKPVNSKTFTVTKPETVNVKLEKNITDYNVTLDIKDNKGNPVPSAEISVTYEEEDEYWETYTKTVSPVSGTTYKLNKYIEYDISVSAGKEYTKFRNAAYTPSGEEENITLKVVLNKMSPEQEKLEKIKKKYDDEFGPLRPDFHTEKNVKATVLNHIADYADVDTKGITVEVVSTADEKYVAKDGKINYKKDAEPNKDIHNIGCTFKLVLGDAEVTTANRTVQVGWDNDHVNSKIKEEAASLTIDRILGENKDKDALTKDLTLIRCMGNNLQKVWSVIEWDSSDPSVISFETPDIDSPIYPLTGKIHPQEQDKEVTLTATLKVNDTILNTNYERIVDFVSVPVEFKVTVKGTAPPAPTEEELRAILDKYYTNDLMLDAITSEAVDFNNVNNDFLLPRYTKIKDENQNLVFENKEITVTSTNDKLVSINGYRAKVDPFGPTNEKVSLKITFTRQGVTAEKVIPLTVIPVTDDELDKELSMMEVAKTNYFAGINDKRNPDKEHVTADLHNFMEMNTDESGNPVWIYKSDAVTGKGIIPDNFFEDPWEMESAGYNKFKSSDSLIIKHDNLLVTQPDITTEVTISSLLSSGKYGKYAPLHPENEKLQKLYKQKAEVTVKVTGSKASKMALNDTINEAKQFADSMTIGNSGGEYKEEVKTVLNNAVKAAETVLNNKEASDDDATDAAQKLLSALETAKASKNPMDFRVSMTGFSTKGMPGKTYSSVVTHDAASKAGFTKPEEFKNDVTALDALVVLHQNMFGEDFNKKPSSYLAVASSGMITKMFGTDTTELAFSINGTTTNTNVLNTVLKENDKFVAVLLNSPAYKDQYLEFTESDIKAAQGEDIKVTLKGHPFMTIDADKTFKPQKGYTVKMQSLADKNVFYTAVTDENGVATLKALKPGKYEVTVSAGADYFFTPLLNAEITAIAADYSKVDNAIAEAGKVDRNLYKDLTSLDKAVKAVVRNLDMSEQETVDKYASDIISAIKALEPLDKAVTDENGNASAESDTEKATITADSLKSASNSFEVTLEGNSKVVYDKKALDTIKSSLNSNDKKITVELKETADTDSLMNSSQKQALADNRHSKVFSIVLQITDSNGAVREMSDFNGGKSEITVNYNKPAGVNLVVYRVEADGSITEMDSSYADGKLTWTTGSHSFYMVSEVAVPAVDNGTDTPHTDTAVKPGNNTGNTESAPGNVTNSNTGNTVPKTGDTNNMTMWIIIILIAVAAVVAIFVLKKKNRK